MKALTKFRTRIGSLKRDDDGSVTIEFALWLPFFAALLVLTVDVSMLFMTQSNYWSVARDTARLVARHAMDESAAESYAAARASLTGVTPTTDVTIGTDTVTVLVSVPANQIATFNAFGLATNYDINAVVSQAMEPL
ncbi:TadE/TadG family type IV pilus assembly protein [Rhodovulum sp. YNF3179]|uniref:TadE/TadG family type IV pilus assembly protein n=1 Tax=Rhodovulum sp. YNF3179 TaxID=3425127 RepID=UPI003D33AC6D